MTLDNTIAKNYLRIPSSNSVKQNLLITNPTAILPQKRDPVLSGTLFKEINKTTQNLVLNQCCKSLPLLMSDAKQGLANHCHLDKM